MHWVALLPVLQPSSASPIDPLSLGIWSLQFTPRVTLVEDLVLAEVEASVRLFGGIEALHAQIEQGADALGAHVSWAPTGISAIALARQGINDGFAKPLSKHLDHLPLEAIAEVARHKATLARVGCRTLGQVRALPRGGLSRRFGKSMLEALDRAYGVRPEAYEWLTLPETFQARLELLSRVETAPALLFGAKRVRQQSGALAASWTPGKASGQVARVAARFALVGVAGELATEAGLTGWEPGESERATKACFEAWLLARGGAGNGEVTAMLRQVRGFLEAHGEGRFTWWHRATDDHNAKTLQRAGFRRLIDEDGKPFKILKTGYTPGTSKEDKDIYDAMTAIDGEETRVEYFVLPEVFRTEICRGFDYKAVCKVLLQHGCLKPAKGREYDAKHRLPGVGHAWCYQFTPAIMELEI